jgi:glycosyltransferase involved in cell wall biosynthesis
MKGIKVPYLNLLNPSIASLISKHKPDVVVLGGLDNATMLIALSLCRMLGIPVVLWTEETDQSSWLLTKTLYALFAGMADCILVPGTSSRSYMSHYADRQKIFESIDCVDNELIAKSSTEFLIKREELRTELGFSPNQKVVLFVGQLVKRKGVDFLLEAYGRLRNERSDISLMIVGSGERKDTLVNYCATNRISGVLFIESGMPYIQLIKLYCVADIFVLPSLLDVWGMVINEAMACGLPIIATKTAAASLDLVKLGVNGFIVDPANAEQLYDAIKKISEDDILRKNMASASLEMINKIATPERAANGFVQAILFAHQRSTRT